jgi:hypothetical protein
MRMFMQCQDHPHLKDLEAVELSLLDDAHPLSPKPILHHQRTRCTANFTPPGGGGGDKFNEMGCKARVGHALTDV